MIQSKAITASLKRGTLMAFCLIAAGCTTNPIPQYENPPEHPLYMSEMEIASHGSDFASFYRDLLDSTDVYEREGPVVAENGEIRGEIWYYFAREKAEPRYSSANLQFPWHITFASATSSMRDAIVHAFRGFCTNNEGDMDLYQKSRSGKDITPKFVDATPSSQGNTATFLRCVISESEEHYVKFDSRRGWGNVIEGKPWIGSVSYQDYSF